MKSLKFREMRRFWEWVQSGVPAPISPPWNRHLKHRHLCPSEKWAHCSRRMDMSDVVPFLLHLEHASFAASQKTHSLSLLGICSNGICYERTKTHTMNILCCCLSLCGRGGHTRQCTDVLCDVHDMENKTQAFLNSPSSPAIWRLTTRESCSRWSQTGL